MVTRMCSVILSIKPKKSSGGLGDVAKWVENSGGQNTRSVVTGEPLVRTVFQRYTISGKRTRIKLSS